MQAGQLPGVPERAQRNCRRSPGHNKRRPAAAYQLPENHKSWNGEVYQESRKQAPESTVDCIVAAKRGRL